MAGHVDTWWRYAEDVLLLEAIDSEDDSAGHGGREGRRNCHSEQVKRSVNHDCEGYAELDLVRYSCETSAEGHDRHNSHELEPISVELKLDRFRVEDVSDKAALRCQEARVFNETPYWFITDRPSLNNLCAAKERVFFRPLITVDLRCDEG